MSGGTNKTNWCNIIIFEAIFLNRLCLNYLSSANSTLICLQMIQH